MADEYCLRLVAAVPEDRREEVAAAVAAIVNLDRDLLLQALSQPLGALIIRSGSIEHVTEVKLALRREGIHTESELLHHAAAIGRPTLSLEGQDSTASGRTTRKPLNAAQQPTKDERTAPKPNGRRSVIPDWLRPGIAWYLHRQRHEQFVIAGVAVTIIGMMLPAATFFGRSASFMQLSEIRAIIVLALLGGTIWATLANHQLYARVTCAIGGVVIVIPFFQMVSSVSTFDAEMRRDDIFGIGGLFVDEVRLNYLGWLVLLIGVGLALRGTFSRGWGEVSEPADGREVADDKAA